jgi:hypothetical protein
MGSDSAEQDETVFATSGASLESRAGPVRTCSREEDLV